MHQSLVSRSILRSGLFVLLLAGACSEGLVEPSPKAVVPTEKPSFNTDSLSCLSGYSVANGIVTCNDPR